MPRKRQRFIIETIKNKVKIARVVAIQGCRQSGKSYLAREILPDIFEKSKYLTFDQKMTSTFASSNPESFLKKYANAQPVIIDEAQKVPEVFKAIKGGIDQKGRRGQFILFGTPEFSGLFPSREALKARMSCLRLFPLTLAESLELKPNFNGTQTQFVNLKSEVTRPQLLKYFEKGGLTGMLGVRDEAGRESFFQDWIGVTLHQDLNQFPGVRVDFDVASDVLQQIPLLPEPTAFNLAKAVRKDTRTVQKILNIFEELFIVHCLKPFRTGTGKPIYFLCDVGLASYLGAKFERQIWTWLIQEQIAKKSFYSIDAWEMYYFSNSKGKCVHLVLENKKKNTCIGIKIVASETMDLREFDDLKVLKRSLQGSKGKQIKTIQLIALGPVSFGQVDSEISSYSWENMV